MTDLPVLNVVVVAYGSPDLLERCLNAVGATLAVLVIDNSSSESVRDIVVQHRCRYIDAGTNVGFAAGVNRALAELGPAHGDVLLLNPDALVTGEVARALQAAMRAVGNERVACVSPALIGDGGQAKQVEWSFPTPRRAWVEAAGLGAMQPARGFLIGAVLLLRDEAIDDVGWLDERFFLYAEETDWQRRALNAGWSALLCPDLVAGHTGAATSPDDKRRQAMFHTSVERYVRKWYGTSGWQIFRIGVLVGAGARFLVTRQRALHRDRFMRYLLGPVRRAEANGRQS